MAALWRVAGFLSGCLFTDIRILKRVAHIPTQERLHELDSQKRHDLHC